MWIGGLFVCPKHEHKQATDKYPAGQTVSKLMVYDEGLLPPDLALTEREHCFWGIPKTGERRVKGYPPYALLPDSNFRTSPIVSCNTFVDKLGRRWGGYLQTGDVEEGTDHWSPARWHQSLRSFEPTFDIYSQTSTLLSDDRGDKPRPIALASDPGDPIDGVAPLYLTAWSKNSGSGAFDYNAFVLRWDGTSVTIPADQVDPGEFYRRTHTPDLLGADGAKGWGNLGSLLDEQDLTRWKLEQSPEFRADYADATAAAGHNADQPGYGRFTGGFPVVPYYYNERWYAIALIEIFDMADSDTPLEMPRVGRAAAAIWRLNADESPDNPNAWAVQVRVFAPFDVDNVGNDLPSHATVRSSIHFWAVPYAGKMFLSMLATMPINEDSTVNSVSSNYTFVWVQDGGGINESLQLIDPSCEAGPLVVLNNELYAPQISTSEQKLYLFKYHNDDGNWHQTTDGATNYGAVAATPVVVDLGDSHQQARIATAFAQGGRISVVYGRRPTVSNDAPITAGDPAATAWQMLTWTATTDNWRALSMSYFPPGFSDNDNGLYPRLLAFKIPGVGAEEEGGGGGGGIGGGSGPCDTVYFPYGTSTISRAVFAGLMTGSPLLDGTHTADDYYDAAEALGLNVAFVAAIWTKESIFGRAPGSNAPAHNVGNIRVGTLSPSRDFVFHNPAGYGDFAGYDLWYTGAIDDLGLINADLYRNSNSPDPATISSFLEIYAPRSDGNDTDLYISQACARMAQWADESGL
jgi:hypothetical protein